MTKSIHRFRKLLAAAGAALALSSFAAAAVASAQAPAPREITMQDAERIALEQVPGGVVESIERDYFRRTPVYEVDVIDQRGVEHEVIIDARDGRVIRVRVDWD